MLTSLWTVRPLDYSFPGFQKPWQLPKLVKTQNLFCHVTDVFWDWEVCEEWGNIGHLQYKSNSDIPYAGVISEQREIRGVHSSHFLSHFWFHFSEKWSQKWGEKQLKNIHFSKMDIMSVFDTFPFFIHFLSSVFQVTEECFTIVCSFCCCPIWQSSHFVHHPHDRTSKKIKIKNF